jgi:hypothetical protein
MQRSTACLRFVAGLAALVALPFTAAPSQGADKHPSAWRFRTDKLSAERHTVTVTRAGSHEWFEATDASGKKLRVTLPPRFGSVQRDGKLVPIEFLRPGDRVQVWGHAGDGRFQAARVWVVTEPTVADSAIQSITTGCCAACASCTRCDSGCSGRTSRTECLSCCVASCCPSASCCA